MSHTCHLFEYSFVVSFQYTRNNDFVSFWTKQMKDFIKFFVFIFLFKNI